MAAEEEEADRYDVFDASDNDETTDERGRKSLYSRRQRNVENVAVRDYEVENIDSEDDEEIESDDAFDESDEERFGGYRLGNKGRVQGGRGETTTGGGSGGEEDASALESEEDDYNDDDDDDDENMVDLSEMLDASGSDDDGAEDNAAGPSGALKGGVLPAASAAATAAAAASGGSGSEGDGISSDDDGEDDVFGGIAGEAGSSSESDDEEGDGGDDDGGRLARLGNFVTAISARAPKRRFVDEAGGGFGEDEHAVGTGLVSRGVSLGISDLLGTSTAQAGSLGSAAETGAAGDGEGKPAREMRALHDKVRGMEKAAKRAGSGVVAAPAPKRLQDQMDRKVAYAQTKKEVSQWQTAVDANRNAEHLSFPLSVSQAKAAVAAAAVSTSSLAQGSSGAGNEMERQIQSVLEESGMTDKQQRQYEELELQSLTPEEVRGRQRELRLMRELMFCSEQKAKRMAKIKSKAYRRILKKDKTRAQDKAMEKLREEDPEMYALVVDKMAMSRAEERMTLRHKNTSKWAREMSRRSHGDGDAQQALRDQLDQHDALKRKIYDLASDEDLSDYEAGRGRDDDARLLDGDDGAEDQSPGAVKARASAALAAEMAGLHGDESLADDAPHKSLFDMKFMRTAMERKREQALQDAQRMRAEIDALDADGSGITKAAAGVEDSGAASGRRTFGGGVRRRETVGEGNNDGDDDDDASESLVSPFKRAKLSASGQVDQVASAAGHRARLDGPMAVEQRPSTATASAEAPNNPWISEDAGVGAGTARRSDKLSAKLREKRDSARAGVRAEDNVLLDVDRTLATSTAGEASNDGGIEIELVSSTATSSRIPAHPLAFTTQRELVEQAFAEDDVVEAEFAAAKEEAMDAEAPKDQDLTLPGWGSWGGAAITPKKSKVVRKAPAGSGVEKGARKDARMGSVIISQKQLKAANKYYSSNVPFPYYSADQYEDTLHVPLGNEWNTAKSHAKMIKPRILTKAGRIIDPLAIPSKKQQ
ncbi:hypothetical protein H4S06_000102 [Coemansia sp. BCRC 34490]|nr:hypothetical protein H4S06_000102 [Coemansia sp. BCRC 34490]